VVALAPKYLDLGMSFHLPIGYSVDRSWYPGLTVVATQVLVLEPWAGEAFPLVTGL
jgi:hypothetical protein